MGIVNSIIVLNKIYLKVVIKFKYVKYYTLYLDELNIVTMSQLSDTVIIIAPRRFYNQ